MKKKSKTKICIIVCNGIISQHILKPFIYRTPPIPIFSADGASNTLYKLKIRPQFIVGDLDSIKRKVLNFYAGRKVTIEELRDQGHNDLEKAIISAISKKFSRIFVTGFGGKRDDHTINNFSILKKYSKKVDIRFIDYEYEIFFAKHKEEFDYRKGETISLEGMPAAYGIRTYGLKFGLKNQTLEFGKKEGALNEAIEEHIKIVFKKGDLLIFRKHFSRLLE